jgi:hypothetical protein
VHRRQPYALAPAPGILARMPSWPPLHGPGARNRRQFRSSGFTHRSGPGGLAQRTFPPPTERQRRLVVPRSGAARNSLDRSSITHTGCRRISIGWQVRGNCVSTRRGPVGACLHMRVVWPLSRTGGCPDNRDGKGATPYRTPPGRSKPDVAARCSHAVTVLCRRSCTRPRAPCG